MDHWSLVLWLEADGAVDRTVLSRAEPTDEVQGGLQPCVFLLTHPCGEARRQLPSPCVLLPRMKLPSYWELLTERSRQICFPQEGFRLKILKKSLVKFLGGRDTSG